VSDNGPVKRAKLVVIIIGGVLIVVLLGIILSGAFDGSKVRTQWSSISPDEEKSIPTATPFRPGSSDSGINQSESPPKVDPSTTPIASSNPSLEDGQNSTANPARLPTLDVISPYSLPAGVNPLTGLMPEDPSRLERRPMAVKITNFPRYVRPQSGLTLADVVFEYYIEDELTRFIAVFYGKDAEGAGPVRSGRFIDEHVAHMYHAYLVFKYADPRVYEHMREGDLADFLVVPGNGTCPPFTIGKKSVDTYNNIFFNTLKFQDCLAMQGKDNARQNLRVGYFYTQPPISNWEAERIYTRYSPTDYHYWDYVPDMNKYVRYQEADDTLGGKPESYALLTDALTGEAVTADNVVVLLISHIFANQFDEEDEVYHIELNGTGNAFIFRDGKALPAIWWRLTINQPLSLTDLTGNPIPLHPGNTFYQVLGKSSYYWAEGNQWHFDFSTP